MRYIINSRKQTYEELASHAEREKACEPVFLVIAVLVELAACAGAELICATVSPDNEYSERNILRLGYRKVKSIQKYGFTRNLFCKALPEDFPVCPEGESSEA